MSDAPDGKPPAANESDAWSVVGYLVAGPLMYGGLGWLLDRWLQLSWLIPAGIGLGMALGMYLTYLRFGRS